MAYPEAGMQIAAQLSPKVAKGEMTWGRPVTDLQRTMSQLAEKTGGQAGQQQYGGDVR